MTPSVRVVLGPKGQLQMVVPGASPDTETTLELFGTAEAMLHQIQRVLLAQQLYGRQGLGTASQPVQAMLQDPHDVRWGEIASLVTKPQRNAPIVPVRYSMGPGGKPLPALPDEL